MTITTSNISRLLFPGVREIYGKADKEWPRFYNQIFNVTPSDKAYEEYMGWSGLGLASILPENDAINMDSMEQGFLTRIYNVGYATGFMVSKPAFDDDLYGMIIQRKGRELSFSAQQTIEILAHAVLNNAFDNTNYALGGDGTALCYSAHAKKSSTGTWSNVPASDSDLCELALEQADIDIMDFRNDRGNRIYVRPRALVLPKELKYDAQRILGSDKRVETGDNDTNALKDLGTFDKRIITPYLTDPDAWFVLTTQGTAPGEGLVFQMRQAPEIMPSDDPTTLAARFTVYFRVGALWTDPRCIYGCQGG